MTVKDVLLLASQFVGEKELCAKLKAQGSFTDKEQQKIDLMVDCFNLVNQEIASDYLPFLTKEQIDVDNSTLLFSKLSKPMIHVYEIKNRFGMNLKFKLFSNFVEIEGKAKTVVYSYLPSDLTLESEIECPSQLSARIYAYGVASEYLLIDGISEDATTWEERYKESLFMLTRKRGEHIMPKRSWF